MVFAFNIEAACSVVLKIIRLDSSSNMYANDRVNNGTIVIFSFIVCNPFLKLRLIKQIDKNHV
jgi:hypothetical protein